MTFITSRRRSERLPVWLRRKIPLATESSRIEGAVRRRELHTICREGLCPNRAECYSKGKVTFMMLGDVCTRGCGFCSVTKGKPAAPDRSEPERIAAASDELGLTHVIVTSVTRDDLHDGGASWFAGVIEELRALDPAPVVEVLVPDFGGDLEALDTVLGAGPDIFSHNMETVRRLYSEVRKGADYDRKLVWHTLDGFDMRPYYREEDLEKIAYLESHPGQPKSVLASHPFAQEIALVQG